MHTKPSSIDLMPHPFSWITIPAGNITLSHTGGYLREATDFHVPAFQIGKYPVTNAQFRLFVEAGGYQEDQWWRWSQEGLAERNNAQWTHPLYWDDAQWNGAEYPVVGVSWYEAIAFCLWLSDKTGETITLPTEQQWQRAGQGDDARKYPWGDGWEVNWCNNHELERMTITPVSHYEGLGDSPFGVVDMAGNVWEWCATNWATGDNALTGADVRVVRGGSWDFTMIDWYRVLFRQWETPSDRSQTTGFRLGRFINEK